MNNNSTMKKVVLILLAVMIGSMAIAAILIIQDGGLFGLGHYSSSNSGKETAINQSVDEEKKESISGVDSIVINDVSENIKFLPSDSTDEIKAHFYGSYSSLTEGSCPKLEVNKSGNTVNIKIEYPKMLMLSFSSNLKLDIYIPQAYSENLKIATTSADTEINEMNLKSFIYNTVSGNLSVKTLNSEKTEIHVTSGDTTLNGTLGDFVYTSISGKLTSDSLKSQTARIEVTSGDVELNGNPGETSFKSISGKLDIDYSEKISSGLTVNQTSGDVFLKLPSDSGFGIDFNGVSGDINCGFPVTVNGSQDKNKMNGTVGSGGSLIKMNSVSGNLNIEKK